MRSKMTFSAAAMAKLFQRGGFRAKI